jgi:hypothetical protein
MTEVGESFDGEWVVGLREPLVTEIGMASDNPTLNLLPWCCAN